MLDSSRSGLSSRILVDPLRILDTLVNNLDGMVYRCKHDDDLTMLFVSQGLREPDRVCAGRPGRQQLRHLRTDHPP